MSLLDAEEAPAPQARPTLEAAPDPGPGQIWGRTGCWLRPLPAAVLPLATRLTVTLAVAGVAALVAVWLGCAAAVG